MHAYVWYDPAERRTHNLLCERWTRYRLSQPDTVRVIVLWHLLDPRHQYGKLLLPVRYSTSLNSTKTGWHCVYILLHRLSYMFIQWGTNNIRLPDRWRHLGSGGWWVRNLSVVCLHNNAIVARCILDTYIVLWDTRTASAPSILLVLLEPHYTVPSESISTKYARVLWQISFVYSQAENNDFYAAVCKSRLNAQYAIPLRDWPDVRVGLVW